MYSRIRKIDFEISENCNALCPMCVRTHNQHPIELGQHTFRKNDKIDLERFRHICKNLKIEDIKSIDFCGNYGDPAANTDFQSILGYCLAANPALTIKVSTNGSLRTVAWWGELGKLASAADVTVVFGIDGITNRSHSRYRVNTSFDKVIANATAFISNGGRAEWQMLVFQHNEGEVDAARRMAAQIGFSRFFCLRSDRFEGFEELKYNWKGSTYTLSPLAPPVAMRAESLAPGGRARAIDCEALRDQSVFVDSDGYVLPCCYLGLLSHLHQRNSYPAEGHDDLRRMFDQVDFSRLDAAQHSLTDIVKHPFFTDLRNWWSVNKPKRCFEACAAGGQIGSAVLSDTAAR